MTFCNKTILITGGIGSFGIKFTEILLKKYYPKAIRKSDTLILIAKPKR